MAKIIITTSEKLTSDQLNELLKNGFNSIDYTCYQEPTENKEDKTIEVINL